MSIKGMNNLLKKLDSLGGNSREALRKGLVKGTKKVQASAKALVPVDDGRLRNSIQDEVIIKGDTIVGKVSTNVEYAAYVEFGTGQRGEASPSPPKSDQKLNYRQDWTGMKAQPYLYPSLKNNEEYIKKAVINEVSKEIRKLRKK